MKILPAGSIVLFANQGLESAGFEQELKTVLFVIRKKLHTEDLDERIDQKDHEFNHIVQFDSVILFNDVSVSFNEKLSPYNLSNYIENSLRPLISRLGVRS